MDRKEIEEKVKEILAKKLSIPKEKIAPESKLMDDLGMDSFGAIEFVFEMEDTFNINIPEGDLKSVRIVEDIIKYLEGKINS